MSTKKIIALLALTPLACLAAVNVAISKNLVFENTTSYSVVIEDSSGKQLEIDPKNEITTDIFKVGDEIICSYNNVESNTVKVQVFSKQFSIRGDADTDALVIEPVSQTKKAFSKTKSKILAWYKRAKDKVKNRKQGEQS